MRLTMGSIQSVSLCLPFIVNSRGRPVHVTRSASRVSGKQRCLHPLLTSAPEGDITTRDSHCKTLAPTPSACHVTRSASVCIPHGEFNSSEVEGTIENQPVFTIKLFRCTNRSHSVTLAYLSILV